MSTKNVTKAVIPIAGWGTRMYPASKCYPKALFPVVDLDGICKPVIHVIIKEALSALGPEGQVCIVVQPGQQEYLESYFTAPALPVYAEKDFLKSTIGDIQDISKRLHYVVQNSQEGFGHAILCAKDFVGNEPFLALLGDHIYTTSHPQGLTPSQQLVEIYRSTGKSVTSLGTCTSETLGVNGIVKGNYPLTGSESSHSSNPHVDEPLNSSLYLVSKIAEKPGLEYAQRELRTDGLRENEFLCFFGIDLLTPKLFEILEYNFKNNIRTKGELQLRDAMDALSATEGMMGLRVAAQRHDTGNPLEYALSIEAFRRKSEEIEKSK